MGKVAFVFPGQGAQKVGMGYDISREYPEAMEVFERANESLQIDIKDMCFNGPEEELIKTENTQPAILTTSIAILAVIKKYNIDADVTAGLSLGEYASLVYSGAIEFEDAVRLVKKRGKYMQETVPIGKGTMAAIIGLDRDDVEEIVKEAKEYGIVEGANYNCPGQIVISGEVSGVEKACEIAKEKGAKKAVMLPVSAPFHSELLKPAGEKLFEHLKDIEIKNLNKRVISNVTGKYINSSDEIKGLLKDQVSKPVLWEDSIKLMLDDGIDTFIEIGPGKSLSSFAKKIAKKEDKKITTFSVRNLKSLEKLLNKMG
ncbi:ACP S-malonyltransferase [Dethiothermospora halolimnae]|uniref:ACP S-malonyltransferase n=1 Tax=Dethiothermospora halolimnae TaxID=3114390 RepID=UPI003CCB91AE